MAIDFAKKGADLVLVARNEEKLKLALKKVEVSAVGLNWKVVSVLMLRLCESPLSRNSIMSRRI